MCYSVLWLCYCTSSRGLSSENFAFLVQSLQKFRYSFIPIALLGIVMRQLLDFIPLIIFFTVYKLFDIFLATKSLIAATAVILLFLWVQYRRRGERSFKGFVKEEKMQFIVFFMVLIFGSLTIYFKEQGFLVWKVTTIYFLFALALLLSQIIFKKPIIKSLLGKEIKLPDPLWNKLNLFWGGFFALCALVNLYVGYNFSLDVWVDFKTFVFPAFIFIATLCTGVFIYKYLPDSIDNKNENNENNQ